MIAGFGKRTDGCAVAAAAKQSSSLARGTGDHGWLGARNARRRCRAVVDSGAWVRIGSVFRRLGEESCDLFCPFVG
jgi:hypothetical protein